MTNRLIKLRMWDKEQGAFVPLLTLPTEDETRPVVQFTGVHDYFGNEIWEGDIIKWVHCGEYDAVYNEYYYEVAFRHGCFGTLELLTDGEYDMTPYQSDHSADVVAGNVFQHSYLLTQSLCLQW